MITALVGLLIFVGVYVVADYLLHSVRPLQGIASTLAVVAGVLAALAFLGYI